MNDKFFLQKAILKEETRPDYRLGDVLKSSGLNLADYYPCRVHHDLFLPSEIPEVMSHMASFGNELVMGREKRIDGHPVEGVFAFKRNPKFKYVRYLVPGGYGTTLLEYLLLPVSEGREAFLDYIVDEIANLEYQSRQLSGQSRKHLDRLFLDPRIRENIFGQIEMFLDNRDFYVKHNLPWKLGILLHGPPGNGKTLLIKVIGEAFNLETRDLSEQIYFGRIHLEEMEKAESGSEERSLTRYECYRAVYGENMRPRIYYFEDIDKRLPSGTGDIPVVAASELLQKLDGVVEIENVIVIATTNHMESLVQAIVARPGRFDIIQEIGLPGAEQIEALLEHYGFEVDDIGRVLKKLDGCSMAFVENFVKVCILTYKKTKFKFAEVEKILNRIREHARLEEEIKKACGDGWERK